MKHALAVVLCIMIPVGLLAADNSPDKARVFITDSQVWSIAGAGGGGAGGGGGAMAGGARPQTAEIVKTFGERCPQIVTNNKQDRADYIVVLDHEGGKGWLQHKNKVAVFNRASGDSVISKSTLSLGGSVQEACDAINADWTAHGKDIRAAEAAASAPPEPKVVPAAMQQPAAAPVAAVPSAAPAASPQAQLQVTSTPDGADIEIDGSFVGNTPSNVGVTAGQHELSVKKTGFKPWDRKIAVSSGQVNVNAVLEPEVK